MTTFERLQRKIKKQLNIDLSGFRRTYAGTNALEQGGYSWEAYMGKDCKGLIVGSAYNATTLLKAKEIEFSMMQFFPKRTKDGEQE